MADLTDLEIAKLCADAMAIPVQLIAEPEFHFRDCPYYRIIELSEGPSTKYDPLHNDEHAMALVKNLQLSCDWRPSLGDWFVHSKVNTLMNVSATDLNRAICECVAKMQLERSRG